MLAQLVGRPEAEANAEDGFGRKYGLTVLLVAIRNAHNTDTFEMCTAQESYSVLPMFPRSYHGSHGDTRTPHAAPVSGMFGLVIPPEYPCAPIPTLEPKHTGRASVAAPDA